MNYTTLFIKSQTKVKIAKHVDNALVLWYNKLYNKYNKKTKTMLEVYKIKKGCVYYKTILCRDYSECIYTFDDIFNTGGRQC